MQAGRSRDVRECSKLFYSLASSRYERVAILAPARLMTVVVVLRRQRLRYGRGHHVGTLWEADRIESAHGAGNIGRAESGLACDRRQQLAGLATPLLEPASDSQRPILRDIVEACYHCQEGRGMVGIKRIFDADNTCAQRLYSHKQ